MLHQEDSDWKISSKNRPGIGLGHFKAQYSSSSSKIHSTQVIGTKTMYCHAEAIRPPASELPGIAEDGNDGEAPSERVRIPARRYRRALAEHLCERAAALRSRGELGVCTTCSLFWLLS